MKRIIELPDNVVKAVQNGEDYRYDIYTAIAQSTPYNPTGDLISREAFKKHFCKENCGERQCRDFSDRCIFIDELMAFEGGGTPTIEDRPQGDCQTCEFRRFTEGVIGVFVDLMNKYGITSVEELKHRLGGGENEA